jgi:hypothetical protein
MSRKAPPILDAVNVDQLRADIDSGKTGDKIPFPDPAAAPLGTDAEAAGYPPSRRELRMEMINQAGSPVSTNWPEDTIGIVAYCAAVLIIGLAIVAIVLLA